MLFIKDFYHALLHALKNLLPIVAVVLFFQLVILRQVPDDVWTMTFGLLVVAIGVALFLQGLELSIFPIGKSLANQFAWRGSIPILLSFGFAIGFSAVVAEPALIAVAEQAQTISEGRIDSLTLRLLVATSVGFVIALGVFRTIMGYPLRWFMIIGYLLAIAITYFAPEEIIGIAYDSGGVTTNIVTVPLITAIGVGLAISIRGRNPLIDGFGLAAMAAMAPRLTVQLYGIYVYSFDTSQVSSFISTLPTDEHLIWYVPFIELLGTVRDVLPIMLTILFFQYLVLRRRLNNPRSIIFGFVLVVIGLHIFVLGLKLGLFPIGNSMAEQLIMSGNVLYVYLFAFMIGFSATMAEPALIAVGKQAEECASGKVNGSLIRIFAALGLAIGITIGAYRVVNGASLYEFIVGGYALVIILTLMTPKYIIALAYDLGGVTTSDMTVPLITALGIGLATHIEGRNVLIDGFGLIAFASIFPIVTVMIYAIFTQWYFQFSKVKS